MGGSSYSSSVFSSTIGAKLAAGADPFSYSAKIDSGAVEAVVHPSLDPSKKNKGGKVIRESRDSDAHPNSTAVAVLFDETGSMTTIPRLFVEKLPSLMSILTKKGYISDPHVLFGAIGDAFSDNVPLQVGQFEGGNEMDTALTSVYLEANGGGQYHESYELAMYFLARHTKMDCLEKRGQKGYLFILGDEMPYKKVNKDQVKRLIGDTIEADIPLADILAELREKFEVFWIFPKGSNYWDTDITAPTLKDIFGQHFIKMPHPENVSELIATTIGITEGFDVKTIEADLVDSGSTKSAAKSASTALAAYTASTSALSKRAATLEGTLATATGADSAQRL